MPGDDIRLHAGDRLVVLANIEGLRRVEVGSLAPRRWLVRLEAARHSSASFTGGNLVARVAGCSLGEARELMEHLPATLRSPLYRHQAQRLVRELLKAQVTASVLASESTPIV